MTEHHRNPHHTGRSPGAGGTEHDPLPFEERYRKALDNPQLRRNLLNFQRSWGVSRDGAFDAYDDNPVRVDVEPPSREPEHLPHARGTAEFEAMRNRLAAIKNEVIDRLPEYLDRFQHAAEEH